MKRKLARFMFVAAVLLSQAAVAAEAACFVPKGFGVSPVDKERLNSLSVSRTLWLGAALKGENDGEQVLIGGLFDRPFVPLGEAEGLVGSYRCRTIKMGGGLPFVVYGWFSCEIFTEEAALVIRKTSGSQRFLGVLVPAGEGYAYKGALSYGYESVSKLYGEDPERNQVGCLSATGDGPDHLVLEMPAPRFESVHDVIEMLRTR
ncbi:MAG TPA: DUF4893 domain-containing protein [Devosia sp.]|nr:DUF4893 domain-containing protein [Devosia sp.]